MRIAWSELACCVVYVLFVGVVCAWSFLALLAGP